MTATIVFVPSRSDRSTLPISYILGNVTRPGGLGCRWFVLAVQFRLASAEVARVALAVSKSVVVASDAAFKMQADNSVGSAILAQRGYDCRAPATRPGLGGDIVVAGPRRPDS